MALDQGALPRPSGTVARGPTCPQVRPEKATSLCWRRKRGVCNTHTGGQGASRPLWHRERSLHDRLVGAKDQQPDQAARWAEWDSEPQLRGQPASREHRAAKPPWVALVHSNWATSGPRGVSLTDSICQQWRRGRDSNPRTACTLAGFQDQGVATDGNWSPPMTTNGRDLLRSRDCCGQW